MKLTLLLSALVFAPLLRAADDKKDTAPAKEEKSAETKDAPAPAAAALPRVSAGDIEGVKKLVGQQAVVYGKVISARAVDRIGMSFLDLDGGKFTVVSWKDAYAKFPGGQSPAAIYKGKTIEVTGKIEEYKKGAASSPQPQIKLTDPSQIKVIEDAKDAKGGETEKKDDTKAGTGKKNSR